jgi:hypothetical protein
VVAAEEPSDLDAAAVDLVAVVAGLAAEAGTVKADQRASDVYASSLVAMNHYAARFRAIITKAQVHARADTYPV